MVAGVDYARGAVERARKAGDRVAELCASSRSRSGRTSRTRTERSSSSTRSPSRALPELEASGDDRGLWLVFWGHVHGRLQPRADRRADRRHRALPDSRTAAAFAPVPRLVARGRWPMRVPGPDSRCSELLAWLDEHQSTTSGRSYRLALCRAGALAMAGAADEAQAIVATVRDGAPRARTVHRPCDERHPGEQGVRGWPVTRSVQSVSWERRASSGRSSGSAATSRPRRRSERLRSSSSISLAEAETWTARAAELAAPDDMVTQLPALRARALLLSLRGDHDEAELVARHAVDWSDATDLLRDQAEAYATLGRRGGAFREARRGRVGLRAGSGPLRAQGRCRERAARPRPPR